MHSRNKWKIRVILVGLFAKIHFGLDWQALVIRMFFSDWYMENFMVLLLSRKGENIYYFSIAFISK